MVLQITSLLLLASIFLLIDGDQNQKDKEILALKINIAKLDTALSGWKMLLNLKTEKQPC